VAKQFPDTASGEYAQLIGAGRLFTEGNYADAQKEFSKFIDAYPNSSLLAQAKMGLAACLEGQGKIPEAAQKYQEVVSQYPGDENIVSPAKLTLARLDEQLKKPEQALTYYSELARVNNPYDPWAAEARERGELLLAKHPELRKPPPGAAGPAMGLPPGALSPQPGHVSSAPGKSSAPGLLPFTAAPKPAPAPAKPQP
jgi:predicted negative regulator of RcsB-dependent stress response